MNLRVRRRPSQRMNLQSCQREVLHTTVSCLVPARVCSLVGCWQHVTGFFSTCAVHQVSQISHSVLSVLDTPVVSERQCSRSSRHHLSATLGASYFMQYLYLFRHTCRGFLLMCRLVRRSPASVATAFVVVDRPSAGNAKFGVFFCFAWPVSTNIDFLEIYLYNK